MRTLHTDGFGSVLLPCECGMRICTWSIKNGGRIVWASSWPLLQRSWVSETVQFLLSASLERVPLQKYVPFSQARLPIMTTRTALTYLLARDRHGKLDFVHFSVHAEN